ncbi:hypothetical protein [Spartinivicinus ruber]|uniref:hypothetical protein n=1 Tax=Spartinivicinus ruber TaxID=2683272 RepID=UPI0013D28E8F|nr:hypothetical protein [Spartinivicinus ruber]
MSNSDIAAVTSISDSIETNNLQSNYQIISLGAVVYQQSTNKDLISDDSETQSLFGEIEYGLTITAKSNDDTAKIDEFFQSTPTVELSTNNDDFDYLTGNEYNNLSGAGDSDYLLGGAGNDILLGNDSYYQEGVSSLIDPVSEESELSAYQVDDLIQSMASFNQREAATAIITADGGLTDIDGTIGLLPTTSLPQ